MRNNTTSSKGPLGRLLPGRIFKISSNQLPKRNVSLDIEKQEIAMQETALQPLASWFSTHRASKGGRQRNLGKQLKTEMQGNRLESTMKVVFLLIQYSIKT